MPKHVKTNTSLPPLQTVFGKRQGLRTVPIGHKSVQKDDARPSTRNPIVSNRGPIGALKKFGRTSRHAKCTYLRRPCYR